MDMVSSVVGSSPTVMCWIAAVCLHVCMLVSPALANQQEFLQSLQNYEIAIPTLVTDTGRHISHDLHPEHSLRRRSVDFTGNDDDKVLHYSVQIENKVHVLRVQPNKHLVAPGLVIERRRNTYGNVTDSRFTWLQDDHKNCHYHGHVVNQTSAKVAVGVCNGLHGFIHSESGEFLIEPLHDADVNHDVGHRHAVYRRSAMPQHLDPLSALHLNKRSATEGGSCGVKDGLNADQSRERWERHHRKKRQTDPASSHRRSKRSVSTERYVETLVVVDPSMIKYHKNEHLETYVLTILNMVATMFHDASIGNSINIALVRILLLEEHQEELVITHHADKTLQSFCKFQKNINFKDDDHPNHHDVAVLLTRKNICSRVDEPCGTLGLAQVSGMCQPHRSCSINEDTGLALAYTITHEIGHNFGMHHDGFNNGCTDPPGRQLYIMASSLIADSLPKSWSNCSQMAITKFIDRDWGYCLNDEPVAYEFKFPVLPPGTMYDADHQCRLQYGTDDAEICTNKQDVCSNLWCQSGNKCSTHLEAAAEGTICGTNMWCYEGKCVKIGDRPEAINGEWGEWTSWSECTRTCGAGVSHSQRHCDNPRPSHGGKYCLGERKRYRICNSESCQEDGINFNQQQCAEFNYIPYKGSLYQWDHVPTSDTPCQLHCKPVGQFFSVMLKDIVTDGTPCMSGTRNMCISGRCRHVGCDYVIDSKVKEDRCGVCHGDGSTCTTIKSQFTESHGLGYVEAAVIPKGARNIRVEEVAAANNFLALQNDKGEYYLNGHWFIQWSGDYKVAGTVVQYKREGNKESVEAVGPLKEPLHVMLLLQMENPGVVFEYTVPKDNITEMRTPEFHWHYQAWTHCTASCGGGTQRSEVVCTEIEAGVVDDQYCDASKKPDDKQRVCNEHLCPARWWVGPWQHCSATCGPHGSHQRTVICVRSLGPDEQIALEDEACSGEVKPAEVEPCHKKEECPGNSTWLTGDWSSCNGNHCGLKYRKVWCENAAIGCETNLAPPSEMQCSNILCGQWSRGDWSECTVTCGEGVQIRRVVCEGSEYCDTSIEPHSHRNCSLPPCDTPTDTPPELTNQETSRKTPPETSRLPGSSKTLPTTSTTSGPTVNPTTGGAVDKPKLDTVTQVNDINEDNINEENNGIASNGSELTQITEESTKLTSDIYDSSSSNNAGNEYTTKESVPKSDLPSNTESDTFKEKIDDESIAESNGSISSIHNETNSNENDAEGVNDDFDDYDDYDLDDEDDSEDKDCETTTPLDTQIQDSNIDVDADKYEDIKESQENETVTHHHRHRHHHGDNADPSIVAHEHEDDTQTIASTESINTTNSQEDKNISKENKGDLDLNSAEDNIGEEVSPSVDLPAIPVDKKMPPLPELGDLPPLPDRNVFPSMKDLPPLPDFDDPSKYPDISTEENEDRTEDKTDINNASEKPNNQIVPKANFPALQNPNVKLPNLKDLPKLEDLPPLPDLDKLPKKDPIPPLPKKMDLSHLPSLDNLPPLPDMKHLANKKYLPPLASVNSERTEDDKNIEAGASITDKEIKLEGDNKNNIEINLDLPQESNIHKTTSVINEPVSSDITKSEIKTDSVLNSNVLSSLNTMDVNTEDTLSSEDTFVKETVKSTTIDSIIKASKQFVWKTSNWNECSRQCNHGVRTRTVMCINDAGQTVDQNDCDIVDKPTAIEDCNMHECLEWQTSQWTECSATCGYSRRVRQVWCPTPGQCDSWAEPTRAEVCPKVPDCVVWVSGQWSRCTKKCDGGEQVRLVQCVNLTSQLPSHGCDPSDKPQENQACNSQPCQNNNEALKIDCQHNEMSSVVCRALYKMGHCQKRFVSLKCCKTCNRDKRRKLNKDRPRSHALR